MLKLFFDLRHQNITLTNPGVTVASDRKHYLVAKVNTISDDWETPLSAIFVSTVDKIAYTVLVGQSASLESDECFVPWEVLKGSGDVYVSVFSGNLHTTNTAKFEVVKSGYVEGEIPPPPTPTVYEQILEELANKQDVIYIDNTVNAQYNPDGHYILYYYDAQEVRHNIFDFNVLPQGISESRVYEILDATLQGDPNIAPSLYVMTNQQGDYLLVYEDSDDNLHTIFNFSNLPQGSTDYNDLTNKPTVTVENQTADLTGDLNFYFMDFKKTLFGTNGVRLADKVFETLSNVGLFDKYNFSQINSTYYRSGLFQFTVSNLLNIPPAITEYNDLVFIIHFCDSPNIEVPLQRFVYFKTALGKIKIYTQSLVLDMQGSISQQSDWLEIGAGVNVVSGVVNQNGTITFTDSDGGTFNTSGNNIVTSGDQQISMGFDNNGKFYFRFDDGQGE